ncbi:NtaA/DmoA family FMN-dependent monooxygenase [Subtercola sp. YIM 133946]
MPAKPLTLGIFQLLSPNGMSGAAWRHPQNASHHYKELDHWIELAKRFEDARLDFLFFADSYGYPTLAGTVPPEAHEEALLVRMDPMMIISALAAVTDKLGLVVTASTTFEPPYANARRFSTLDHFSDGRMGWNIVTGSAMESAARMFGQELTPHDVRYETGDDYLDLSLTLWESSWEDDAVKVDKAAGVYADPAKVHPIEHSGPFFQASGTYPVEPSPQRTPVLFQAGSSGRGREFAARNAECVFLQGTTLEEVAKAVDDIRTRAEGYGRDRDAIKILVGLSIFTAETPEGAAEKLDELYVYSSDVGAAIRYSANTGINLLDLDPSSTLDGMHGEQGQSNIDRFRSAEGRPAPTVREILDEFRTRGLRGLVLAGTPTEVVDQMQQYAEATGIDGYLLEPHITPGTYDDLIDLILPVMRERGLARTEYGAGTLRERLFGDGQVHLRADHPGARFRMPAR